MKVSWIGFRWKGFYDKVTVEYKYGNVTMFTLGPILVSIWRSK